MNGARFGENIEIRLKNIGHKQKKYELKIQRKENLNMDAQLIINVFPIVMQDKKKLL